MSKIPKGFLLVFRALWLKCFLCWLGGAVLAQTSMAESSGHELLLKPGSGSDIREPGSRAAIRMGVNVGPVTGCVVRVAYIVPSNRTAQSNAVANLRAAVMQFQAWYREEMDKNGFGPKTFRYETEPDGITPRIYTVAVSVSDDYLRGDI